MSLAFPPDGKILAFVPWRGGRHSGTLGLWDLALGKEVRRYTETPQKGRPRLCNVATDREHYRFSQYDPFSCLAFSPDGRTLASSHPDKAIRLWEVATGQLRRPFEGHQGRVRSLAFAPDGRRLISGNEDATLLIWDVTDWLQEHPHKLLPNDLQALWSDLSGRDAGKADRAIWTMAAVPEQTVPFLRQQVRPVAAVSHERIAPSSYNSAAGWSPWSR